MNNILEFSKKFETERACVDHLAKIRFKNGLFCPHCGHKKVYTYKDGVKYKCASCLRQFNARTGTIFQRSHIPLAKWFMAIYLMTTSKKGVSSVQMAEQLGITQKSSWFMIHRIRETFIQSSMLKGVVEVDETYVGGKTKNMHDSKKNRTSRGYRPYTKHRKLIIMGAAQRDGHVVAETIEKTNRENIIDFLKKNVQDGSKLVADDNRVYGSITPHRINHKQGEYSINGLHTNCIESFWATFKRGYVGIYHFMSKKHLQRYVNEFVARANGGKDGLDGIGRFTQALSNLSHRLTYRELVYGTK